MIDGHLMKNSKKSESQLASRARTCSSRRMPDREEFYIKIACLCRGRLHKALRFGKDTNYFLHM
jgi:hypothetical protein